MLKYKVKNCPLEHEKISPLMEHLSATANIDPKGHLEVTFNERLPEHKASEHISLLREYIRGLKTSEPLYELIDTEEIDARYVDVSVRSDHGLKLESFGAFGSGAHDTTSGCISLIGEFAASNSDKLEHLRAIDIGTGTGILAMAAYLSGIRDITAVDISLRAIISAYHNFSLNDMAEKIRLARGSIELASGSYDIVIANIYITAIEDILGDIVEKTADGGTIILSGIKTKDTDRINRLIGQHPYLNIVKYIDSGEWLCLYITKEI
ncbi:MAG: 50S ribosomal protein L11 methyltransferase [Nitrospirota bacterium]|nr:MAG: 50S ribosomal protein L11 methyltransferase [Nitrospirota bacterium]